MRKDELKSNDCCPDCVEAENGNAEIDDNINDECCSCCCSCSDTASETDSGNAVMGTEENQAILSLEQQKKDLLSNLTILQTRREPASVQHILQYVEALAHSPGFLREYNMQQDFCMECLLSEPTCTCCASGISQLNLNDGSCDSCDECNSNLGARRQTCPSQECPDCTSSTKAPNPVRQRPSNRRNRRRRRQRNNRHNLSRVSTQVFPHTSASIPGEDRHRNPPERYSTGGGESRYFSQSSQSQEETTQHVNSCEECTCQRTSRSRLEFRGCPSELQENSSDSSDSCEECARENSANLSSPCAHSSCGDCESRSQKRVISARRASADQREEFCNCCCNSSTEEHQDKSENHKASPECDQNEIRASVSSQGINQPTQCSCNECQSNLECSDESCDECDMRNSRKKTK